MSVCGDSPDTSGMNAAAMANAEIAKEALQWYRERDAREAPLREAAAGRAMQVSEAQLEALRTNTDLANDYANNQRTTFRPLEQGIVADAQTYDTPEKRQAAADAAMADVNKGFASTNEASMRRLAAEGIDPGSARAMAAMGDRRVDQATAQAGAAYKARRGVETVGRAMRLDAANLGRNLASNQATSADLAIRSGNAAVGNASVPVQQSQAATGTYGQGFNTAIRGNASAGSLYGQAAELSSRDNGMWGAVGNIAGQFAGSSAGSSLIASWSDETLKTDIEPVDEDDALEEVNSTPVSTWRYSPAVVAKRGINPDETPLGVHTGPMAQRVNEVMGEAAAPGSKKIDLVTMNGKTMAAVQALTKRVGRLAQMVGAGDLSAGAPA